MVAALSCAQAMALPAFPGAQGFGANALGGRGGDVYHVTSLADTNTAGTLRNAISSASGARTIVFDIGGTIVLTSDLNISKSNLTIAGQTAPGSGITLISPPTPNNPTHTYHKLSIGNSGTTQNDIIRYLTVRRGYDLSASTTDDSVGVLGSGSTHDIILDHITASWGSDEDLSPTNHSTNITVQNSYITEALNPNAHAYGTLVRPEINASISFNHNLYADNLSRNPRIGNYNGSLLQFDFRNNVVYNYGSRASYTGGASETATEFTDANYVGNYLIAGPSTTGSSTTLFTLQSDADPVYVRMWEAGNQVDSNKNAARDGTDIGWSAFVESNAGTHPFPIDSTTGKQMASEFAWTGNNYIVTDSADVAYAKVLASGGGSLPGAKSAIDARIVAQMISNPNTGAIINSPDTTEWNNLYTASSVSRAAGFDTDNDGMPNSWETSRGLNPNVADNNILGPNGYTNLENYLNDLTLIANWNADANGNWSTYLNWRGARPELTDSTANFLGAITAPRTITVDTPVTVGQINFDNASSYTIGGASAITMDVISGTAAITVASGSHTISAPVTFNKDTIVTVTPAGSTLNFTGALTATGRTITKAGAGVAQFENIRAATLNISAGSVRISEKGTSNSSAGTSVAQSLSVAGTLDLTNNSMVIDYTGSSPLGTIASLLSSGYASGNWNGAGINSSTAAAIAATPGAKLTAIGYAEKSAVLSGNMFAGQTVDDTSVLLAYVYAGDSNLDHAVDTIDFNQLAANFGASGLTWSDGNFNFDNTIDTLDFNLMASNFGLVLASDSGSLPSGVVPEPASILLLGLTALALRRRVR